MAQYIRMAGMPDLNVESPVITDHHVNTIHNLVDYNESLPEWKIVTPEYLLPWIREARKNGGKITWSPGDSGWSIGHVYATVKAWGGKTKEVDLQVDFTGRLLSLHEGGWLPCYSYDIVVE